MEGVLADGVNVIVQEPREDLVGGGRDSLRHLRQRLVLCRRAGLRQQPHVYGESLLALIGVGPCLGHVAGAEEVLRDGRGVDVAKFVVDGVTLH